MSKKILHLNKAAHKSPPVENPVAEPHPTRLEHAESTTIFLDYNHCLDEDPVRVAVAASKAARALDLAIKGLYVEVEHVSLDSEDIDLLKEMSEGTMLFCKQAKSLIASSIGADPWTSPSEKGAAK